MRRSAETSLRRAGVAVLVATVLVGCATGRGEADDELRDGVYQFELTEAYLRESGMPPQQARAESGVHEITLDRGSIVDRWRAADGTVGSCVGVYTVDGTRAAFRWTHGCIGEWAMTYSLDGDVVSWSDFEAVDPIAGPAEQAVTEVFNGIPWTRTGDVPEEGEH